MNKKLVEVKKHLKESKMDGWLLYDFNHSNPLALEFLEISKQAHLSRRFFYWIPLEGEPVAIVHKIEPYVLDHMPGIKKTYQTWQSLQQILQETLEQAELIAMEYSPYNALPYVSKVDAGTVEMIKKCGVNIESSGPFLQYFTAVLNHTQQSSHQQAGKLLAQVAEEAFVFLSKQLQIKAPITEYQLQRWVLERFNKVELVTDYAPICAFGVHTADPHYSPQEKNSAVLKANELVLLDFVAKKKEPGSVYGDITRMGFSGKNIPQKCQEVFALARKAQDRGFQFIQQQFSKNGIVRGFEVDTACRAVIDEGGYGEYFVHRTGHNIDSRSVHGSGAHLDGFETCDDRPLVIGTCFTIEPGIYLPDEWGIRVEYDVLIHPNFKLEITSGIQESIRVLSNDA